MFTCLLLEQNTGVYDITGFKTQRVFALTYTSGTDGRIQHRRVTYLRWYSHWERLYATDFFTLTFVGFVPTKDFF